MSKSSSSAAAGTTSEQIAYDIPEIARLLNLSRAAAYDAARRGDIPTVKIGGRILVPKVPFNRMFGL